MPLNNQIQIRRRVKLNIIKVNPLDINHIENSKCRLGWWYAYMAQVCTWRFVYLKSTNFFSHLNSYISPWCHERDWFPASLKAKKKYHKSKGNNWIGNILQERPVDTALKLKLNVPAAHKKSSVFGYRNYSGLIFVGWLNGLIIVSVTNVPPFRIVSLRRNKRILQLPYPIP